MLSITATDLPRFMACNGSRLMDNVKLSIGAGDDTVRNEGNAAHWLAQQIHVHQTYNKLMGQWINSKAPNGVFVTAEMLDHVMPYISGIGFDGKLEYETSFRSPSGQWEVRSRADNIENRNGVLHVDDFKYGWGIVDPHRNWTLIAHALGYVINNPDQQIHTIRFTIYQPRPHHADGHIRSWVISEAELRVLYIELANALSDPSDLLVTGSNCYHCPALANCPAARKAQMNGIDASEMAFNDHLDNVKLSYMLDHITRASEVLEQALKAYKELAAHRVREGQIVKNYTLESDLTNRMWKEFVTPEITLALTGIDLTKKQLITPKQAETLGASTEIVASLTERRNKGAKLVRMDENAKAMKLFNKPKEKK